MQSVRVLDEHRKVLGVIYLVFGVLWALAGLALLFVFMFAVVPHAQTRQDRTILLITGVVLVLLLLAMAALGIAGGMGMMKRRAWSKVLTFVAGIFSLVHFPIGTAVGIYTFWFWLQPNSAKLFYPQTPEPRGPELGGPDLRRPLVT